MEHAVFFAGPDGSPGFRRVGSLSDAIRLVEHLRNNESVTEVSVHLLTEVPLEFHAYYRVEVGAGAAPTFGSSPVPSQTRALAGGTEPADRGAQISPAEPADRGGQISPAEPVDRVQVAPAEPSHPVQMQPPGAGPCPAGETSGADAVVPEPRAASGPESQEQRHGRPTQPEGEGAIASRDVPAPEREIDFFAS